MTKKLIFSISIILVIATAFGSRVLELSDRFLEIKHEGQWFVLFYSNNCAHCQRVEPIWGHVAQSLANTNIRVGKADVKRFTAVARHFKIVSYPTIMFIKGHHEFIYHGDRTKEELLTFAARMSSPPVQQVARAESIDMLKTNNKIFFIFIGKQEGALWTTYQSVAEYFQPHGFFYATSDDIAGKHFDIDTVPSVIIYKEKSHFYFPLSNNFNDVEVTHLNQSLHKWVNEERFLFFPKITRANINQLLLTRKYLVLAVVEENRLYEIASHELEFRDLIESICRKYHSKYHSIFQFGWVGSPDIAHSIVMDYLPTPHLLVLNTTTFEHHIPDDDPMQLTADAIHLFLDSIHQQKATVRNLKLSINYVVHYQGGVGLI
ncbi:Protein disulfide-isomerase TMX3 [Pseudolycoriella hygida]|uniref:Protein disulfide-isomerase TMX3 n=1 Tax=Pseudolycoriella hygida TaxID=35572 RepID=A0A9Q0S2D9_9DIPT|nr:Protein disulfide-isomerase TMX3 [Pseudolycoriella hygida]